jgi:4-hydroxy-3-methylbut-2-enyl diphosphate reductase
MSKVVYYLSPSSFCFGVKRSIDQLNTIIIQHPGEKIFCIHALVHNPKVTKEFEAKGVSFVEDIDAVEDTHAIIILSAHGTNRKMIDEAQAKYKAVYNLECPFVTKIYTEVDNLLKK